MKDEYEEDPYALEKFDAECIKGIKEVVTGKYFVIFLDSRNPKANILVAEMEKHTAPLPF